MKRQVYICGSNGFIGSNLVSFLNKKCNDIQVISYDPRQGNVNSIESAQNSNAIFIYAAYDRRGVFKNIFSIIDAIRFSSKNNISKIIFLSSISIFSTRSNGNFDSKDPRTSIWEDYILIKKIQEFLLGLSCKFNIIKNAYILRVPVVLGKDCSWQSTLNFIASHSSVSLPKSGHGLCNYIYIDDLSRQIADCGLIRDEFGLKHLAPSNGHAFWKEIIDAARCQYYPNSPQLTVIAANENEFAEKFFKNLMFKFRYTMFGYLLEKTIRIMIKALKHKRIQEAPTLKAHYLARDGMYLPVGLLRASMANQMRAKPTLPSCGHMSLAKIFSEMSD